MNQQEKELLDETINRQSIILDLKEFDLSDLDSLKDTAFGNILEKNFQSPMATSHTVHSSHSSHDQFSQSIW